MPSPFRGYHQACEQIRQAHLRPKVAAAAICTVIYVILTQHRKPTETAKKPRVKAECLYGINAIIAALCAGKREFVRLYQQTNKESIAPATYK